MTSAMRLLQVLLLAVIVTLLVIAAMQTLQYRELQTVNKYVAAVSEADSVPAHPVAAFARAAWLSAAQSTEAIEAWILVLLEVEGHLKAKAFYNRGNLYLRQALELEITDRSRRGLLELAKQDYRNALSADMSLQSARYNLELALRAAPEIPGAFDPADKEIIHQELTIETKAFKVELP